MADTDQTELALDAIEADDGSAIVEIDPKLLVSEENNEQNGFERAQEASEPADQADEDHEDDLSDAMNENFDYDEAETPEGARFDMPYYEYQDVESIWGFDSDDTVMTIENESGEEIYKGDLMSFISEAHGDNDSQWDASEEMGEVYPEYFDKGHHVFWTQGGKGSCIQTTIITDGEEFDPRKLKIKTYDIQGYSITSRLVYDDVELDDEGMDSEHDNWRGQWSEFSVHENE